jgi:hypothetical protein
LPKFRGEADQFLGAFAGRLRRLTLEIVDGFVDRLEGKAGTDFVVQPRVRDNLERCSPGDDRLLKFFRGVLLAAGER